tara:strand:+ start:772 stop:909 length:138 start_codon:yes stop_codon:yes gene_type:complete
MIEIELQIIKKKNVLKENNYVNYLYNILEKKKRQLKYQWPRYLLP